MFVLFCLQVSQPEKCEAFAVQERISEGQWKESASVERIDWKETESVLPLLTFAFTVIIIHYLMLGYHYLTLSSSIYLCCQNEVSYGLKDHK